MGVSLVPWTRSRLDRGQLYEKWRCKNKQPTKCTSTTALSFLQGETRCMESTARSISWVRWGSCQNQSCLPVFPNYTLAGAIKQPIRAAPEDRTRVRLVGLLCLQPQSPVHRRTGTHHSSLMPAAWIHDKQICNKSGPIKSYTQAYTVLAWGRQHAHWVPIPTGKTKYLSSYDTPTSLAQPHVTEESKKMFSSEHLSWEVWVHTRESGRDSCLRKEKNVNTLLSSSQSHPRQQQIPVQTSKTTYFV